MSWLTTVRSLLRNLKRTKTSSPSKVQLEQLHVGTHESDELCGLENIDLVGDFVRNDEHRIETHSMEIILRDARSARFCSECVSSLLVSWITILSRHAVDKLHITRNPKLHIENDIYSGGVSSEMTVSFPHKAESISPFLSVIIRERHRPEALISSAELYSLLAMAAKHSTPLHTDPINVRLLVVYSCWVQVLTAKTTPFHIMSIVEGWEDIVDKMEIHQTPWFNFFHAPGQLRILLSAFETIKLEPYWVTKLRMPLKDIRSNSQPKCLKRNLDNGRELGNKRHKLWR